MPIFIYKAVKSDRTITEGEIEAVKKSEAAEILEKRGLTPLSITIRGARGPAARGGWQNIVIFQSISVLDKILMMRHISTMIKAGMSLKEAIEVLEEDATKSVLRDLFYQAKFNLEKGVQLSETFARFPKYFSPIVVNLLKAGEASGNLEQVLDQISAQLNKENELVRKVRSALAYPIILLIASFGVVVLLIGFVLPRLANIFAQSGIRLPLITRIFVAISKVVTFNIFLTLGVIIALVFFFLYIRKLPKVKSVLTLAYNRTPILKDLLKKIALGRFCWILNILLKSGIPIIDALKITATAVSNQAYKDILKNAAEKDISKGMTLGRSLGYHSEYFPRLVTSMINVGEKTGNLETVLIPLAAFYDDEVDNNLKSLVSILEPILLLIVGFVVGGVALSIILPVYQVLNVVR
jgi:type II secretory pathway component PulF